MLKPAAILPFLLAACAAPSVTIRTPADSARPLALAAVSTSLLMRGGPIDGEYSRFAKVLAESFEKKGAHLSSYRAERPHQELFTERLNPSSILEVDFFPLGARGNGTLELAGTARLFSWPERSQLAQTSFSVSKSSGAKKNYAPLFEDAARALAASLPLPGAVERSRMIQLDKKNTESKQAARLAARGLWSEASALWAKAADEKGDWRALFNLAVVAEKERAIKEARRLYERSRVQSTDAPAAAKIPWEPIFAELSRSESLGLEREDFWFGVATAVLPFDDQTTSVDGPAILRKRVWESLKEGGYRMIALEESDEALRQKGYSMGGQLKKGRPENFASWSGAGRLVFGNIAEFRNIMLGAFGRRTIEGTLSLWEKSEFWSSSIPVVEEQAALSPDEAKNAFSNQLGKAFLELWTGQPLAEESEAFVERNLLGLPRKP